MNKKLSIAMIALLYSFQPVFAQAVFGNFDCAQWINSKTETRKAWVLGYMSGMSMATTFIGTDKNKHGDWLDKVNSADQIFLVLDNYCQKNPLRKIESAGFALYLELIYK